MVGLLVFCLGFGFFLLMVVDLLVLFHGWRWLSLSGPFVVVVSYWLLCFGIAGLLSQAVRVGLFAALFKCSNQRCGCLMLALGYFLNMIFFVFWCGAEVYFASLLCLDGSVVCR